MIKDELTEAKRNKIFFLVMGVFIYPLFIMECGEYVYEAWGERWTIVGLAAIWVFCLLYSVLIVGYNSLSKNIAQMERLQK